ncbi:E3 binding domain-containing protein [Jiangella asiatica]|uniref:Peripheral subunit-binding (PSBD) domain-containing protein n=1 Tax=Jiangella asiatica TaxID=2530372 RepID=A0A4R5DNU7_9ACTN|nr:E3 binding domain-containing protein [Jiangella asiatica]TDE16012.1 hypothetical protein E1269_01635 [Jiangella asiatica]
MSRRPPGVLYRTDLDPVAPVPPTPAVLRRAGELGIDLRAVRGTGVSGRIRLRDLADSRPSVSPVAPSVSPAAAARSLAVVEADVTGLLARGTGPDELLARVAVAVLLAASEAHASVTDLSVTVPGADGALTAAAVPGATELSVAGLTRALAAARADPVPGTGAGLTVHDAAEDRLLVELPVVEPAPALLIGVGAPRLQVVPDTSGGGLALAARQIVQLAAASEPSRLPRGVVIPLLRAAARALETEPGTAGIHPSHP